MSRIVCFGEALIDFHARRVDGMPQAPVFVPFAGGAPANVAVSVAQLGGDVAFAGMLGADLFGDMLLRELDAAGVDTRHVRRTQAANTALAFVSHDESGERSFSFYRPPSADLLFRDEDFDAEVFTSASVFHAGSCSLTEPAIAAATLSGMRRARAAGALVSFDINLRPALWPQDADPTPLVWQALHAADLIKASREELDFLAKPLGGDAEAIERLWLGNARMLVVTDGSRPTHWFTRDATGVVPTFPVDPIDTTGAGDAFVGGLLHGLVSTGADLDTIAGDEPRRGAWLRFASACGAIAATRTGSFAAMPSRSDVQRFLEQQA